MHTRASSLRSEFTILTSLLLITGCATPKPIPTAYEPRFSYPTTPANKKIDVTVGIVSPQFAGDGVEYQKTNREDPTVRQMLRGMRAGFNELLLAKGFNASGPFDSLDSMTFPEKKGADFVLYPEFDIGKGYVIGNRRPIAKPTALALLATLQKNPKPDAIECDYTIQPRGTVSFVALEPLSKEKMWVKRLDVEVPAETLVASGAACDAQEVTQEIQNGWAKAHEALFTSVMSSIDKYVSPEEFQVLKRQSAELRARKVY